MSSTNLFLVLILSAAIIPIMAARPASLFGITSHSSNSKPIPSIIYELFDNTTNPGSSRFEREIGGVYGVTTLSSASSFVLDTLYNGQKPQHGKDYLQVEVIIESFNQAGIGQYPLAVASTVGNIIRMNSDYIENFEGDVKYEFTGILYHESTHVWQWTANLMAPDGLINGIADYISLKAGWPSVNWGKRGSGSDWHQGYEVTAYFLEYCEGLKEGFVAELNGMMSYFYTDDFFQMILGKSVDELWNDYKLAYAATPSPAPSPAC